MAISNLENRIGIALSTSILVAILIVLASETSPSSALLRGDFPGFYVLAKIVVSGQFDKLYDLELQRQIQNQAWPLLDGAFLISVYPPSLALALSPLGYLSSVWAQAIFSSCSFLCLLGSFFYLKSTSRFLEGSSWLLFGLILSNPLLLIGTLGGQNTAFSIAIITSSMALLDSALKRDSVIKALLAGVLFSLWLFKPQFGIFVFPALIIFRLWVTAAGFLIGALLHYLAGATLLGPNWIWHWLTKIAQFSELNYNTNLVNQASPFGAINMFLANSDFSSSEGNLITALLLATSSVILLDYLRKRSFFESTKTFFLWIYLAWIPLAAPQTLFYDIGIIFFASLICLRSDSTSQEKTFLKVFVLLQASCWLLYGLREEFKYPFFAIIALCYFCSIFIMPWSEKKPIVRESNAP